MAASISSRLLMIAIMAGSMAMTLQQAPPQQQQQESSLPAVVEQAPVGEQAPQDKAIWPMVDVDRQANKSTVDVHVPIFFDMTNQKDNESGRAKLDLSVLQGLVTVNKDRAPDSNGQMSGPIKVTVFGIPVYQGKSPQAPLGQQTQTRSGLSDRAQDISSQVTNNLRQTNEKVMSGLSEFFGRLSSMVRQASEAIVERRPSASNYERELQQRRQQPLPYEQQQQQQQQQQPQQPQQRPPQDQSIESNQIERLPTRSARDELARL